MSLNILFIEAALAEVACESLFHSTSKTNAYSDESFHKDMENIDDALKKMKLKSLDYRPRGAPLGYGASGVVINVERNGVSYALKLLRRPIEDRDFRAGREAVVIQKILGERSVAQKIIGIMGSNELQKYISMYESELAAETGLVINSQYYSMGILMEKTNTGTLKTGELFGKIVLTREQKASLTRQGPNIARILSDLGIVPEDMDLTVTEDFQLQLIDMGFYRYIRREANRDLEKKSANEGFYFAKIIFLIKHALEN